ncbi:MAG TPA: ATP-grasp domain-containing protein [Myxococcota bacterium]|nr:ATP-grasp domain-containing protein [Myxococcota bacterium]
MGGEIGLLFGGPARERLVSVASAQNVATLLPSPRCFFWAVSGGVFELTVEELVGHARPFEVELAPRRPARWPDIKAALADWAERGLLLLLALHGQMVEDGVLQGWLEERGIPFTGSGSRASRDAFDKARAREIARAAGLRVAEATVVDGRDVPRSRARVLDLLERFSRVVLKPVADGSSMGLRFVASGRELEEALVAIKDDAHPYLAEAFVSGTELTVGVIDDEGDVLRALPCSEVRLPEGGAFGYEAKYLGRGAREITPAEVAPSVARAAQEAALVAHRALGCEGYSRTDLIVDAEGPVYLETNTLPGLTKASFVPQQLAAAGIPIERFLARQIALARRRARGG